MFTHHCTACDRKQLIFFSQVKAVASDADGALATFTCWCGAEQSSDFSLLSTTPAPTSPALPITV